jgi:hypothetical protein
VEECQGVIFEGGPQKVSLKKIVFASELLKHEEGREEVRPSAQRIFFHPALIIAR